MGDELTDREFERYELEEEALEDDALCTCDIDGEDSCPVHYPIDDGGDDDDCMECGVCENCTERTKAFYEDMENELRPVDEANRNG